VRLLLDTQVVLWQLQGTRRLSPRAHETVEQARELAFSVVSFAEIGVKSAIGKLIVPANLHEHVMGTGLRILGLTAEHGLGVADLPMHHRDPFDRLLVSQARLEGLTILTADERFAAYDVAVVAAVGD
jgi:PIN domain nuclease of toxin-antitoxin system